MSMDLDAVGRTSDVVEQRWTRDQALTYALGVGAGQDDPLQELEFTTENSADIEQRVLPVFGVILAQFRHTSGRPRIGDYDPAMLVHAEQAVTMRRALPPEGTMRTQTKITGIYDKGSGALAETEAYGWLPDDAEDEPTVTTRSAVFIRGEGGFGARQPKVEWAAPDGPPDLTIRVATRPDQALLYRLSGDHNPLHSDPAFAARAGFPRPILHGMCTYGVTARVLLRELADSDPDRFASMSGRFSRPVFPGDPLSVSVWRNGADAAFRVFDQDGSVVLDRGMFTVSS